MSAIGLVNLAERLLNQGSTQGQDLPPTQRTANTPTAHDAAGSAEDQFTPSAQNGQGQAAAQEAGLFSVTQFSFFSAAADLLLGQGAVGQPTVEGAGAGAGSSGLTAATPGSTLPGTGNSSPATIDNNATQLVGIVPPPRENGASSAGNAADRPVAPPAQTGSTPSDSRVGGTNGTNGTTGSLAIQQQIQTLNTALASLGLTAQEIQQLDRIASIVNDFNPAAFTALAYQLEQIAAAQAAATTTGTANGKAQAAAANGTGATNPATNATTVSGAGANPNGFQIQELVIRFSATQAQAVVANGAAAQGATASSNPSVQAAAFHLQIEEVNLTLTDGNGQAAQVQIPAANGHANSNSSAPRVRGAAA